MGDLKTSVFLGEHTAIPNRVGVPLEQIFIRDFDTVAPLPLRIQYDTGSNEYLLQHFEIYYAGRQSQRNGIISPAQAGALDDIILNALFKNDKSM